MAPRLCTTMFGVPLESSWPLDDDLMYVGPLSNIFCLAVCLWRVAGNDPGLEMKWRKYNAPVPAIAAFSRSFSILSTMKWGKIYVLLFKHISEDHGLL